MDEIIQKGAKVLLYNVRQGGEDPHPRVTTVTKLFPKSFEVEALTDVKFRRDDLRSTAGYSHYMVTTLDSERAAKIWKIHYREQAKSAAMATVERWNTGHSRDDLAMLNAAIDALTVFRDRLLREQS
jgi:hypothetical protein